MTKLNAGLLGALVLGAGTIVVLQHQSNARLQSENLELLRQHEQFTRLQAENARLSNQLATARQAASLPKEQLTELIRLRGEVALARSQKAELERAREENRRLRSGGAAPAPRAEPADGRNDFPKEAWTFSGYATPEAAFQSTVWALSHGDVKTLLTSMSPEELARNQEQWRGKTEDEIAADGKAEFEKVKGFRILKKEALSENEAVLTLFVDGLSADEGTPRMKLVRINGEWKVDGPSKDRGK